MGGTTTSIPLKNPLQRKTPCSSQISKQNTNDKKTSNFRTETENDIDVIYNIYTKKDIVAHQKILSDENIENGIGTELEKTDKVKRQKMIFERIFFTYVCSH